MMSDFGKWEAELENEKQANILKAYEQISKDTNLTTAQKYDNFLQARAEADATTATGKAKRKNITLK